MSVLLVTAGGAAPAAAGVASSEKDVTTDGAGPGRFHRVAYFTQWGVAERGYSVKDVETSGAAARLTHINYAFGDVTPAGRCASGDPVADYRHRVPASESVDGVADAANQQLAGNFGQLRKLKRLHPDLKVLISLGGWTWSKNFSDAALTPQSRSAFVSSCLDLFIRGNLPRSAADEPGGTGAAAGIFDGVDLDWEWPGSEGAPGNVVRAADRKNFTSLVAEFRRQLDAGRASESARGTARPQLTAFLPADPEKMDAGYETKRLFRLLDFATVQGYDFHGPWDTVTNQQSALRPAPEAPKGPDFSVTSTVQAWIDRGAPRRQLVIGIPAYGHGWTGVSGGGDGMYQPATAAAPAAFEPGSEDYKTLKGLTTQGFTLHRDQDSGQAWLFDGTTLWTLDDPIVVRQKARYIRDQGLGGSMMWSLDGDDASASLTRAIAAQLR